MTSEESSADSSFISRERLNRCRTLLVRMCRGGATAVLTFTFSSSRAPNDLFNYKALASRFGTTYCLRRQETSGTSMHLTSLNRLRRHTCLLYTSPSPRDR